MEELYPNSPWKKIILNNGTTHEAVNYLRETGLFDKVDYDYIMTGDGEIESIDISSNPNSTEQNYLENQGIFDCWGYEMANNHKPGGNPDIIVAVIDTGVDYTHIDLRNNVWINSAEIPNNRIDDDGNGYVDDIHGWDCVGDDNDPIDDNGHGTHVAGIIAAENNSIGTVGVAFNCRIMCIKAGNSSGFFNSSDVAEAIEYAYLNGASIINMSFGGTSSSSLIKDALEDAYHQCVLVAAAGNDSFCNNVMHKNIHPTGPFFPASLPYVIGVMSTNASGTNVSPFSNYDDTPYDSVEYETYACGEQIPSTWPNNRIARLSGTSMASPVVAGIAALLRSTYPDREVYSNKFIQSQIINSGTINPYNSMINAFDYSHNFANSYEALTKIPKPSASLYDYYVFDNIDYSDKNNGNGIIEAGETIRIAIEILNRGGTASSVSATIETANVDVSLTDPYFSILQNQISLPDIGTYSIRDCEKIYGDGNLVIGTEKYFEITIADNCPNNYLCVFAVRFSYKNGLDSSDLTNYSGAGQVKLSVYNGYILPTVINEDTIFYPDKLYVVSKNLTITSGATVIFEPGCKIQFYQDSQTYYTKHWQLIITALCYLMALKKIMLNYFHLNYFRIMFIG